MPRNISVALLSMVVQRIFRSFVAVARSGSLFIFDLYASRQSRDAV